MPKPRDCDSAGDSVELAVRQAMSESHCSGSANLGDRNAGDTLCV